MMYEADFNTAMTILTALMLLSLCIYILYKAKKHMPIAGVLIVALPVSAVLAAGMFYLLLFITNYIAFKQVFLFCIVMGILLFGRMVYSIIKNKINTTTMSVFLAYMAALLFVTILMRDGTNGTEVFLDAFEPFKVYMRNGNASHMYHFFMNMVLFFPFGFLGAMVSKNRNSRVLLVTAAGLLLSVLVESIQLSFELGQCDMSDILANASGALAGGIAAIPLRRVWLLLVAGGNVDDDDEEEYDEEE